MGKATILLIAMISALSASAGPVVARRQSQVSEKQISEKAVTDPASPIHLTIATVGPMLGPPTDRYTVGEQVLITIGMTNTASQPTYACVSSDLYQDLPTLKKNGRLVPYSKWQSDLLGSSQRDQACQRDDLPERMLLKANQPTFVDFLVLVDDSRLPTGAQSWYDQLAPGVYELSIRRRTSCCDGPMLESNKITFEVVL